MKKRLLWRIFLPVLCLLTLCPSLLLSVRAQEEQPPLAQRIAEAKKDIRTRQVGKYGMVPVYGQDVSDGTYPIEVDSSSPFFRILSAELIVENHEMRADITVSSLSYLYVFPGTAEQAENSSQDSYIGYRESQGHGIFTVPVSALDAEVYCAAYSKKKSRWYDRTLVFDAASLPEDAVLLDLPDYDLIESAILSYDSGEAEAAAVPQASPEPVSLPRSDGEYSIEVNMTGGSGRASISSPTLLLIREGKAYARLVWSSAYYDYMLLEGQRYYNLTEDGGNSVFEIPITVMDNPMPVVGDTLAMGEPVEINYALTFYAETIGSKGLIPQEAAKKVLLIAGGIIIIGGVLNAYLKRRRKSG